MPISVSSQVHIFLWSVIGGMLIAFIYDLFRIKRKTIGTINILTGLEDLVYWIIVALVMFGIVYYSNEGEIRGYIFIGTIIGVILYSLVLSKLVMSLFLFILGIIRTILGTILRIFSIPFKLLYRIFAKPFAWLFRALKHLMRSAGRAGKHNMSRAYMQGKRIRNIFKKI